MKYEKPYFKILYLQTDCDLMIVSAGGFDYFDDNWVSKSGGGAS